MKDKFSMYSSRFKKLSKEEYKIYFSHSYKILKEFLSKIFVNIKNMSQMDLFNILKYIFLAVLLIFALYHYLYLSIGIGIIIAIVYYMTKSAENEEHIKQAKLKEQQRLIEKKQLENEYKLKELKNKFQLPITKIINYSHEQYILVNEENSSIMINERIYFFKDIVNFSLSDNSVELFSPTTSTTKTNTGSMIGRAIVGGILTGGTGAIIGGVTAKKTTETKGGLSQTKHDYTLKITINNISNPIERIYVGDNSDYANELCSLFSIIISRK